MSHKITLKDTRLPNAQRLREALDALGWKYEENASARFFDGKRVKGTVIHIPGWHYPVVVDDHGIVHYDDYHGSWGNTEDLGKLATEYAIAVAQNYAWEQGGQVVTETNARGETVIRIQLGGGAAAYASAGGWDSTTGGW